MLRYEIKTAGKFSPVPPVIFEDKGYELVGEFLLAEARSFGPEILAAIDGALCDHEGTGCFAGNAFSLEISPSVTKISDDISGRECEISTADLADVASTYVKKCEELSRRT